MPFELHIAIRYLLARRRQAFISIISLVSTLGVTVGVMALVIALALMTGLQSELRDRILGSTAHIFVFKSTGIEDYQAEIDALRKVPRVIGAAPAIIGRALASSPSADAFISFKGIDPALETSVTEIEKSILSGKLADLTPREDAAHDGIFLGVDLAKQLAVGVGDTITVLTPQGTLNPFTGMMPRSRTLRVTGIFRLGLYEIDNTFGLVNLDVAKRLVNKSQPELIELAVDDINAAPEVAAAIPRLLGDRYVTEDWTKMNRTLFEALWLEKMAISVTIGLIVMVAALNIVASLVLLVMEKSADIAILKTMGASSRSVMYIFMLQGLVIGMVGTAIGGSAGIGLSWVMNRYQLLRVPGMGEVYEISYVPFTLLPLDLLVVMVTAVLICFVATIYPSRQAAKLKPVEALRYG
ncbi:MAG TPA: FtsX-like permease family protein [Vicinamibacterales bacterium]|nr:FtsX-like permease family protein [Vicinamibacterales bacterium]